MLAFRHLLPLLEINVHETHHAPRLPFWIDLFIPFCFLLYDHYYYLLQCLICPFGGFDPCIDAYSAPWTSQQH